MGVFRKRWEHFYTPKRKLPTVTTIVGNIGVSKSHPSRNISLRDGTFRSVDYQYYQHRLALPTTEFIPGILNAVSKVHPSRNPKLRDDTFRPAWKQYYQPKRVLPPFEFVPGILSVKHPRLKNIWDRKTEYRYYRRKRRLPSGKESASVVLISKVHPSQNPRLRDGTFDLESLNRWQHKRVLPPSEFVPGIVVLISKVHPSRNIKLRDITFRPPFRNYYRITRFYLDVPAAPIPPVTDQIVSSRGVGKGPVPGQKARGRPKDRFWLFADEIAKDDDEILGLISDII